MVRSKKQSKRMPARKKFKIAKKVREHNRKAKKEAKKHKAKGLKKDPGIPNLFPLKEQLLKQMEEKKQAAQAQREKERQLRAQEKKRRKQSLQGMQNDAQRRTKEFEKKQALQASAESEEVSSLDRRGLRAYHKEFRQVVEMADVVLEVLDARDPLGTRCAEVEESVMAAGSDKKLILVLNKIDLVPKANVEAWLKHLRNDFPTVAFKASTQAQKRNLSRRKGVNTAPPGVMTSSACLGAELLLKLLGNYCRSADIRTSITVGVVGLPNVGKSSIINSLKRSKACGVGATPGITKSLQEVHLDKHVKLIDSPGIVMATGSGDPASLVLRNCVKVVAVEDVVPAVEAILRRCNHLHLLQHYCIPEFSDTPEFLAHLASRTGKLKKGGVPDVSAAARTVLQDWNTGRILYYTHPPEQHTLPTHISAELVQQWSHAFDLKALEAEEKEQLCELTEKMDETAVVQSEGILSHAYHPSEEEGEEEEEDGSEVEEEMGSEVTDSEAEDDGEEMEEDDDITSQEPSAGGEVIVVFNKKTGKGRQTHPATSAKEEKERARQLELNPRASSTRKKALKKQQKEAERRKLRLKTDGDVDMNEEAEKAEYDFTEYF